jgi:hypothetical protein
MFANLLIEFRENTMKQTGKRLLSFNRAAVLLLAAGAAIESE